MKPPALELLPGMRGALTCFPPRCGLPRDGPRGPLHPGQIFLVCSRFSIYSSGTKPGTLHNLTGSNGSLSLATELTGIGTAQKKCYKYFMKTASTYICIILCIACIVLAIARVGFPTLSLVVLALAFITSVIGDISDKKKD